MAEFILDTRTNRIVGIGRLFAGRRENIYRTVSLKTGSALLAEFTRINYLVDNATSTFTREEAEEVANRMRSRGYAGNIQELVTGPVNDRNLYLDGEQAHRRRATLAMAQEEWDQIS